MALPEKEVFARFQTALRVCGLQMRNWSSAGRWDFAIYRDGGEAYVGLVNLDDRAGVLKSTAGKGAIAARDAATLGELVKTFTKLGR